MDKLPSNSITEEDLVTFQNDGVVCLRGIFEKKWIDLLQKGIEFNRLHPTKVAKKEGLFFHDYETWNMIPEYKEFIFESPVAEVAGRVLQSSRVALYSNHVIVKDSGSTKVTPWHQDQAYYEIDGKQVGSIWLPVDPVSKYTCLRFVKGSHRWPHYLKPVHFGGTTKFYEIKPGEEEEAKLFVPAPDTFDNEDHEVLSWDMQPGDCIVFHMRTVHGSNGNNLPTPRRAFATRWLGNDAVKGERPWMNLPPIFQSEMMNLQPGDNVVESGLVPVVWKQRES